MLEAGEIADIVAGLLPEARIEFGQGPDPDDDDIQGPFVLGLCEGISRCVEHLRADHDGRRTWP